MLINLAVDEVEPWRANVHGAALTVVLELVADVASPVGHSPDAIDKASILIVISIFATTTYTQLDT